jgi:hypothetical protein
MHNIHQYGNMEVGVEKVSLFQGVNNASRFSINSEVESADVVFPESPIGGYLALKYEVEIGSELGKDAKFMRELEEIEKEGARIGKMSKEIVAAVTGNQLSSMELDAFMAEKPNGILDHDCHGEALDTAFEKCPQVFKVGD